MNAATVAEVWEDYWSRVGSEDRFAARDLLEVSPRVRGYFAAYIDPDDGVLNWDRAADDVAAEGFSATEGRLADLVVALTTGAPVDLVSLSRLGSWQCEVWRVLVEWGTDGACTTADATGATPAAPASRGTASARTEPALSITLVDGATLTDATDVGLARQWAAHEHGHGEWQALTLAQRSSETAAALTALRAAAGDTA